MDGLLWQPLLVCAHNAAEGIKLRVHLQSRDTLRALMIPYRQLSLGQLANSPSSPLIQTALPRTDVGLLEYSAACQATCPTKQASNEVYAVLCSILLLISCTRPDQSLQDPRPQQVRYQQLLLTAVNMVLQMHNSRPPLCLLPPFQAAQHVPMHMRHGFLAPPLSGRRHPVAVIQFRGIVPSNADS